METANSELADRDIRQRDIMAPDRLRMTHATVIGVGAIGRQVALQLASIGVGELTLIDPDVVNVENLAVQGYRENQLERDKADATAEDCSNLNTQIIANVEPSRFGRSMAVGNVVFMCVDTMASREFIWIALESKNTSIVIDARMSAETCRIITASDTPTHQYYETTLFPDSEAQEGACTSKSTIYCANIAAGLMVGQFSKWLRGLPLVKDFMFNILGTDLMVLD